MIDLEINYDAGRESSSYKHDRLSLSAVNQRHLDIIYVIMERHKMCHKSFEDVCSTYKKCRSPDAYNLMHEQYLKNHPYLTSEYHFLVENWLFQMRRTIDSIIQLAALKCAPTDDIYDYQIDCAGIEDLLRDGGSETLTYKLLFDSKSRAEADPTQFLSTINDIFNAMKHHWIREKSFNTMGADVPTVYVLYRKNNDPKKNVVLHNHNAFHIMMGFQDMVRRLIENVVPENPYA